jgi:hypothetical protein
MGKVEAFRLQGIECWFNSQDHSPPHFHARKKGKWHVRVYFLEPRAGMFERVPGAQGRFGAGQGRMIYEMVKDTRDSLLLEWERKVMSL